MKTFLSYEGGLNGDLFRALVNTGLMDKKFKVIKHLITFPDSKDKGIYVTLDETPNENPEVDPVLPKTMLVTLAFVIKPTGQMLHNWSLSYELDTYREMWNINLPDDKSELPKLFKLWTNKQKKRMQLNDFKPMIDIGGVSCGHDHINFVMKYKSLKEFNQFMYNWRNTDRIMYLHSLTEKGLWRANINSQTKNKGKHIDVMDKRVSGSWRSRFQLCQPIVEREKTDKDIIVDFEITYDKYRLKKFIERYFKGWSDHNYDFIYDSWYDAQLDLVKE